jgi:hypothetical protein
MIAGLINEDNIVAKRDGGFCAHGRDYAKQIMNLQAEGHTRHKGDALRENQG